MYGLRFFRKAFFLMPLALVCSTTADGADLHWDGSESADWHTAENWEPVCGPIVCEIVRTPNSNDDVYVQASAFLGSSLARLSASEIIANLRIRNGHEVDLNDHRMQAQNIIIVNDNSVLTVRGSGSDGKLEANQFDLGSGGTLALRSNFTGPVSHTAVLRDGVSRIFGGGTLEGEGSVLFEPQSPSATPLMVFENRATIRPLFGRLWIQSGDPNYFFDLDGESETGTLDVDDGTFLSTSVELLVTGKAADPFDGTLLIGQSDTANFSSEWHLGTPTSGSASVTMNGNNGVATLRGTTSSDSSMMVRGAATQIDIISGTALFDVNLDLAEATMSVGSGTTVQFAQRADFASSFNFQSGPGYKLIVDGAVTFDQQTIDWDSPDTGTHTTTINAGASLEFFSQTINPGDNTFRGFATLNGGLLRVATATPWHLFGQMQLNHVEGQLSTVAGAPLIVGNGVDLGNDSRILVTGAGVSAIGSSVSFRSDAEIEFDPNATLLLTNNADFELGVEVTGGGTLRTLSTATFDDGISLAAKLENLGTLEIGGSSGIGSLQVDAYTQTDALSRLVIDALGDTAGEFDAINVDGAAQIGGAIELNWMATAKPEIGDTLSVVTASNISGLFETLILPSINADRAWVVDYTPSAILLKVVSTIGTDTEPDGDVDGQDFLILQRNNPALIPQWQLEYGNGNALVGSHSVPEPATITFAFFGMLSLVISRFEKFI